jgi:plastocyanin
MRIVQMLLLLTALAGTAARAEDHVVTQKGKAFSVTSMKAKVGDTLTFENLDPFVHNIFSLSDVQSFDLGTFGKDEKREIKLEHKGILEVECAIHPEMRLVVDVE